MKLLQKINVLLLLCSVLSDAPAKSDGTSREESRSLQDFDRDWRIVNYFTTTSENTSGWTPKGRRIRKRKRRPPILAVSEDAEVVSRRRVHSLDEMKEPWDTMSEDIQKTNTRRRLTPIFDENEQKFERVRDPFTALQKAEEKQKKLHDLKTILKNRGGLSLSEVLQQKNLSLSELLQGNQEAISAIAGETETTTIGSATEEYKMLFLQKDLDRNFEKNSESAPHEIVEAQRKRLGFPKKEKDSKLFSDLTRVDMFSEEIIEKRILVPSSSVVSVGTRKLPMTSARLKKLFTHPHVENTTKIPEAIPININKILGFKLPDSENNTEQADTPFKMTIDLEELVTTKKTVEEKTIEIIEQTTLLSAESPRRVSAKDEILEILEDPIEKERLSKILHTKNMTVEELVALRERGSSQLHLADIFHNKTREPEPKDEPLIGHIQPDNFFINRRAKNLLTDIPKVTTTAQTTTTSTKLPYTITSFPTYKIETNKDIKRQPFFPLWQQLQQPSLFSNVYEKNPPATRDAFRSTSTTENVNFEDDLEELEAVENALAEAANSKLKVDLSQNVYEDDFINLPSGVKSAILASLAIVGLSLIVFLTILVTFKWSHKQKTRLNYNGSFSGSKINKPILEPIQRRTFRTFISETLGKRNYYKSHLNRMSDSIWDEKKSYMI